MESPLVLLVDGDSDSLVIYSLVLQHHGYRVLSADSAAEGARLARERRPDLVVAELFLPPAPERSLPEQLRRDPATAPLPVIGLSTLPASAAGLARAYAACDTYLVKPCVPSQLLAEVERLLGTRAVPARFLSTVA